MRTSILFSAHTNIDFQETREGVLRIPEVQAKIREAQRILDKLMGKPEDLAVHICCEDEQFWAKNKLRKIATGVVQLALLERWQKRNPQIEAVVGINSKESPLQVVTGEKSLADYIADNLSDEVVEESYTMEGELILCSGVKKANYIYFIKDHEANYIEGETSIDPEELVLTLYEEHGVGRFINVGPGENLIHSTDEGLIGYDLRVEDVISTDPMLLWFIQESKASPLALAN